MTSSSGGISIRGQAQAMYDAATTWKSRVKAAVGGLSIVVCTYNRADSLKETLDSLNQCSLPDGVPLELLVVDNNSSDATAVVCREFAGRARMPFRYVVESAQGLSFARNRAIREATGDAIVFTDDDVLVNREWIQIYEREFGAGADCVFGRIHPDWRGNRPSWFDDRLKPAYALLDYGANRLIVTGRTHEFYGANFAVRRQTLEAVGGFDVNLGRVKGKLYIGEETRVFLELLRRENTIVYNPAIEVYHVIEEGRKNKAYLVKYFRDTADSLVYSSLLGSPRRRVLGVPYYRVLGLARFYATLIPRLLGYAARRDTSGLFFLRLEWIRNNRMLFLYARRRGQNKSRTWPS